MLRSPKKLLTSLCLVALASGLTACASATSTAGFSGESKAVAETIKNFQSDITAADEGKICKKDLSREVVSRLNAAKGGCEAVIKNQLAEIDSVELTIDSIKLGGSGAAPAATARVKSIYAGKSRHKTLTLVKEGSRWKIAGVG